MQPCWYRRTAWLGLAGMRSLCLGTVVFEARNLPCTRYGLCIMSTINQTNITPSSMYAKGVWQVKKTGPAHSCCNRSRPGGSWSTWAENTTPTVPGHMHDENVATAAFADCARKQKPIDEERHDETSSRLGSIDDTGLRSLLLGIRTCTPHMLSTEQVNQRLKTLENSTGNCTSLTPTLRGGWMESTRHVAHVHGSPFPTHDSEL